MKEKKYKEPTSGVLTNRMDVGSEGFKEFQEIVAKVAKEKKAGTEKIALVLELKDRVVGYLMYHLGTDDRNVVKVREMFNETMKQLLEK